VCQQSKDSTTKYKCHREKTRKEEGELQRQLEEARSKAKADAKAASGAEKAVKAEHQRYWWGYEDRTKFFRELLVTLAPEAFNQDGYFKVYVKYVKDCR